jgi:hypothetical protein
MGILCKNGRFHWKASCYNVKFKLLWNYKKCFQYWWNLAKMLTGPCPLQQHVQSNISCYHGNGGPTQNCQKSLFCIVYFSIKTDFKVLQLPNELRWSLRLFSIGNMLPYDPKFSWRCVGLPPLQTPKQKGAHPPSCNLLMNFFYWGRRRKCDHFFINISQTKISVLGLNRAFVSMFQIILSAYFNVYQQTQFQFARHYINEVISLQSWKRRVITL